MLCHPCILGNPQQREAKQNQKWLPHPCLLGAEVLRHPCILGGPQRQARGSKSSKLIQGQFHIGDGPKRHHLGGKEAQKGKNSNKNRGKRVYRGICYIKIACVYVPLYCLYCRIIAQTTRHRVHRKRRRMGTPLGTGVLLCGSGHGRLGRSLWASHSLLGRGLLAFEWGGGGLNILLDARKCTFNLDAAGGLRRARQLSHTLQIFTTRFNNLHSAININNAQHIVHKTGTDGGEGHIQKEP